MIARSSRKSRSPGAILVLRLYANLYRASYVILRPMSLSPSDCTQPGCDRRALAGATLCGSHLRDENDGLQVIWSGGEAIPSRPEAIAAPERPKRSRQATTVSPHRVHRLQRR